MPYLRFMCARRLLLMAIAALSLAGISLTGLHVGNITYSKPTPFAANADKFVAHFSQMNSRDVTIEVYYRGYGNTVINLTPWGCIIGGFELNGAQYHKDKHWCDDTTLDLKQFLHPGSNTLKLSLQWLDERASLGGFKTGISAGPALLRNYLQAGFTLLCIASLLSLAWIFLREQGWDKVTCALYMLACCAYAQAFYYFPLFGNSQDLERHIAYLQYVRGNFFTPYLYDGMENWHPPTYYLLCNFLATFFRPLGVIDLWQMSRLVALACYAAFIYFGVQSFRLFLNKRALYLASAVLIFCPSGLINAVRINNDVLFYPFYAASFYYTLLWYRSCEKNVFTKALLCCGLAFMVKTSALVPAGILGLSGLYMLATKRCALRDMLNKQTAKGWGFVLLGLLISQGKAIYHFFNAIRIPALPIGPPGQENFQFADFFSINLRMLVRHPFFEDYYPAPLWNNQIKAMLFSNTPWEHQDYARYISGFFEMMGAYILVFLVYFAWDKRRSLFPVLAGLFLPFIASDIFLLIIRMRACMDFHYIHPVLIAVILAYFLAVEECKGRVSNLLYYAGHALVAEFVVLMVVFEQLQWY